MYDNEKVATLKKNNFTVFEEVYSLRLEIFSGCNLSCHSCGRGVSNHGAMSDQTFDKILSELTSRVSRIEFGVQGEPSLHPRLPEFVKKARARFPKVQLLMISNTEIFRKRGFDKIETLFANGLNFIHADIYTIDQLNWITEKGRVQDTIEVKDYYKDGENAFSKKNKDRKCIIVTDETRGFGTTRNATRVPHNFGGNLPYEKWKNLIGLDYSDFPMMKECSEPLKYMTVNWNGDVTLCCREGAKAVIVGNTNNERVQDIWQGQKLNICRALLKNKHRNHLLPCILCNARSFRTGLYPYWGPAFTWEYIYETLESIHKVNKEEPLYSNIIEYIKEFPNKTPQHIRKLFKEEECF